MMINLLEIKVPSILTSTTRNMRCKGWPVHSPLLAHQVQRVDLEDLPGWRSCDVWMWCLYLMLCFPTGEVFVSGKDGGFPAVFFVIGLGQQDISITEGVTDLGAVPTINHRYRLMERRRHIRTCRKTQPTFGHETSHCISQSKVGSIFFHDGLDRSQKHPQLRGYQLMVTLTLEDKSSADHWRYLISAKKNT